MFGAGHKKEAERIGFLTPGSLPALSERIDHRNSPHPLPKKRHAIRSALRNISRSGRHRRSSLGRENRPGLSRPFRKPARNVDRRLLSRRRIALPGLREGRAVTLDGYACRHLDSGKASPSLFFGSNVVLHKDQSREFENSGNAGRDEWDGNCFQVKAGDRSAPPVSSSRSSSTRWGGRRSFRPTTVPEAPREKPPLRSYRALPLPYPPQPCLAWTAARRKSVSPSSSH